MKMFYNHGIFIDIVSRSDPSGAFSLVPYSRKHTCLFIECHSVSIFARQNTFLGFTFIHGTYTKI